MKGASKGNGFLRASDRKVPAGKCRIWKRGERGASAAKRYFPKTGNTVDFREWVSRSIWPSKLGLSCDRILPERGILFFGGEVSIRGMFLPAGDGLPFPGEVPHFAAFLNAAFVGGPTVLSKTRKQRSAFSEFLSARGYGWLRRLRNEAWKK